MKNLAGTGDNMAALNELRAAGIPLADDKPAYGECDIVVTGELYGWTFERAWTYWVAKGPAILNDRIERFNNRWGRQARAHGFAGGLVGDLKRMGDSVGLFHIDTQAGLLAFANELEQLR